MIISNSSTIGRSALKIINYISERELSIVILLTILILIIVVKNRVSR